MNKIISGFFLAAVGLAAIPAAGRTLAPNARLMLEGKSMGVTPMRFNVKERSAAPADESRTVGAYIMLDDENAVSSLEALGVLMRHNHGLFYSATVPVDVLAQAGEVPGVKYISLGNRVELLNDYARSHAGVDAVHNNTGGQLPAPFTGSGVVVGLIDIGVEYGHVAFRDADGNSRIKAVWNQRSSFGTPPEEYGYGVEYTTPEKISQAVFDTSTEFHGCHTMGTAAGGDFLSEYYGVAPDADIVFVSLDQENSVAIADGIKYIFDYADRVGKPCVINMSLGDHIGPHNGTSPLDKLIDEMSGPGRIIVGACGNEGAEKLHVTETFTPDDCQLKTMLTQGANISHNLHYLEVWGKNSSNIKVKICVVNSLKGNIITETRAIDTSVEGDKVITALSVNDCGVTATVLMAGEINPLNGQPHVSVQCQVSELSAGRLLGVVVEGEAGQTVDIWNYGHNEFSSNGKNGWTDGTYEGTVGEIGGTANRIISVGSFDARNRIEWNSGGYSIMSETPGYEQDRHSYFSSYGPTADGRIVPNILAAGNPVVSSINKYYYISLGANQAQIDYVTNGVTVADGDRYYYAYNIGTSMAAPFVAGTVALMLEANPELTPEQARSIITSTASTDDYMGELPNNTYGAGRINSAACVREAASASGADVASADVDSGDIRVWAEGATVYVASPAVDSGCVAMVYTVAGNLIGSYPIGGGVASLDASSWGNGIFLVNVRGAQVACSRKVAL
ncbi:MAG: S8 family serine peptidase [Muribaculaceae bacterium]|nr:S8 family serine peptidase [Muribaculaceae bacterium]